jgi:predicted ATPase
MLQRLRLRNFRSFRDATVAFGSLNIVLGANASGKTNLMQAFRFLRDLTRHDLEYAAAQQGGVEYLCHLGSAGSTFTLEATHKLRGGGRKTAQAWRVARVEHALTVRVVRTRYAVEIAQESLMATLARGRGDAATVHLARRGERATVRIDPRSVADALGTPAEGQFDLPKTASLLSVAPFPLHIPRLYTDLLALHDFTPKTAKRSAPLTTHRELSEDASNLAQVLARILQHEAQRARLQNLLRYLLPHLESLEVAPILGKEVQLQAKEPYFAQPIPAALLSEGTVEVIALVVALFFSKPHAETLLFEEPDRSLHPQVLARLMHLLREVAARKQLIFTTHSPEILRHARVEDLLLVERDAQGGSVIKRPAELEMVRAFLESQLGLEHLFVENLLSR